MSKSAGMYPPNQGRNVFGQGSGNAGTMQGLQGQQPRGQLRSDFIGDSGMAPRPQNSLTPSTTGSGKMINNAIPSAGKPFGR